jgi:hypothetical protein
MTTNFEKNPVNEEEYKIWFTLQHEWILSTERKKNDFIMNMEKEPYALFKVLWNSFKHYVSNRCPREQMPWRLVTSEFEDAIKPKSLELFEGINKKLPYTSKSVLCLTLFINRGFMKFNDCWFKYGGGINYWKPFETSDFSFKDLYVNIDWPEKIDVIRDTSSGENGYPVFFQPEYQDPLNYHHLRIVSHYRAGHPFMCFKLNPTVQIFWRTKPTKSATKN